jgi:hypothetical protein
MLVKRNESLFMVKFDFYTSKETEFHELLQHCKDLEIHKRTCYYVLLLLYYMY